MEEEGMPVQQQNIGTNDNVSESAPTLKTRFARQSDPYTQRARKGFRTQDLVSFSRKRQPIYRTPSRRAGR